MLRHTISIYLDYLIKSSMSENIFIFLFIYYVRHRIKTDRSIKEKKRRKITKITTHVVHIIHHPQCRKAITISTVIFQHKTDRLSTYTCEIIIYVQRSS